MHPHHRTALRSAALSLVFSLACRPADDSYIRGHGLAIAKVTVDDRAQIVDAAIHSAFDVVPGLILRLHALDLPRTAEDTGATPVPSELVSKLKEHGLVSGTCKLVRSAPKATPHCSTSDAGYIIRTSDVFAVSKDTTEIYFAAEQYGPATGQKPQALRFEKVYELVKSGKRWRVAREGRIHEQ